MSRHHIQQFILAQLSENDTQRYRDMKPVGMEPSQFMYHLKQLISQGLVTKLGKGEYALSSAGWLYVDRADSDDLDLRPQARIGAMIICNHPEKGILYVQRGIQPARGYVGFPIVDIPLGYKAPLVNYVSQAFEAFSGLKLDLTHRADGYVDLVTHDELAGSLLAHVMTATTTRSDLKNDQLYDFFWEKDLTVSQKEHILSSSEHILGLLEDNKEQFFFFEHTFSV